MSDKDTTDPDGRAPGDRSGAGFDAMLAASDGRLLAAIRRSIDLDAGLAQIIGDPPKREMSPPVAPADDTDVEIGPTSCAREDFGVHEYALDHKASDVSSRITRLRFKVLDLTRTTDRRVSGTTVVLLRNAASHLKDLNRGLEARELTRLDASSLLDDADNALKMARAEEGNSREYVHLLMAVQCAAAENERARDESIRLTETAKPRWRRWLTTVWAMGTVLAPIAIAASILGPIAATHSRAHSVHPTTAMMAVAVATGAGIGVLCALFVARRAAYYAAAAAAAGRTTVLTRILSTAMAQALLDDTTRSLYKVGARLEALAAGEETIQRSRGFSARLRRTAAGKIDSLREELGEVRPHVMRLFDEADDCSPCGAPRT